MGINRPLLAVQPVLCTKEDSILMYGLLSDKFCIDIVSQCKLAFLCWVQLQPEMGSHMHIICAYSLLVRVHSLS